MMTCNARLFVKKSLNFHRTVDDIILAESGGERPKKLNSKQRKRIEQIQERANHSALVEAATKIPNGIKLLKRIQATLADITKYTPSSSTPMTTRSKARAKVSANAVTPEQAKPGSKTAAKPKSGKAASTSWTLSQAIAKATNNSIKSETGCVQAYELFLRDPIKFSFCLMYIKNANLDLAKKISRRCKCKKKAVIRKYVKPIPERKAVRSGSGERDCSSQRAFFIRELRDLALVAAALAVYGETKLSALFDSKSLEAWQKIASVSDECRDNRAPKECLKRAGVSNMQRKFHAAHFLGLDLAIRWNDLLAAKDRLSAADMRYIFNLQCNMAQC